MVDSIDKIPLNQAVTAAVLNRKIEEINDALNISISGPGTSVTQSRYGRSISVTGNSVKTRRIIATVTTCIDYTSQDTYTLEIVSSGEEIEVDAPYVTCNGDGDLRHYMPWFPVGSGVQVIKEDGIWYIKETLIYVGDDEDSSLRWNETDERAMAVWK